jgi:hypothetical protein
MTIQPVDETAERLAEAAELLARAEIDVYYGNAGSYCSVCMACGGYGIVMQFQSVKHTADCKVGRVFMALDAYFAAHPTPQDATE